MTGSRLRSSSRARSAGTGSRSDAVSAKRSIPRRSDAGSSSNSSSRRDPYRPIPPHRSTVSLGVRSRQTRCPGFTVKEYDEAVIPDSGHVVGHGAEAAVVAFPLAGQWEVRVLADAADVRYAAIARVMVTP